jgi:hypothetical protein
LARTTPKVKPAKLLPRANAKLALSNARKIAKLTQDQYGPVQKQITRLGDPVIVTASRPICFQLNNPGSGLHGPQLLRSTESNDYRNDRITDFAIQQDNILTDMIEHVPNGPKLLMKYVKLQFRVSGFLDTTRVRFDVVRQKKLNFNIYDPHTGHNFMPALLPGFKNTVGFTPHKIDRNTFQVLQSKTVYMNSRASSNILDTAEDRATTDATTPPVKIVNMYIPMNKVCRQLDSSMNEETMADNQDQDAHDEDGNRSKGTYSWDNQHPLANLWLVIGTDDESAVLSQATGDRVLVDIIREVCWRDPVSTTMDNR